MVSELTADLEKADLTQTQRQAIAKKLVSVQSSANKRALTPNPTPRKFIVRSNSLRTQRLAVAQSRARTISQADRYSQLLAKAEDAIQNGSPDVAGEIAFSILNQSPNRLSSLPAKFRTATLDILVKTNRLETLIESTRRAYRNAGYSDRLREELANLYVLNGTPERADQLWEDMIEGLQLSAREIIVRAGRSKQKRNYDQAASLYLCAFSRDPSFWKSHWRVFSEMLAKSGIQPLLFQRLCKLDVSELPLGTLCEIVMVTGDRPFHEAQR